MDMKIHKQLIILALMSSVSMSIAPPTEVSTIRVEIDLFSGRSNPVWDLAEAEVSQLKARLDSLPASAPAALPDRLGYRGLRAGSLPSQRGAGELPSANPITAIEVGGGVIKATRRDGTAIYLKDTGRSVECWLLAVAQGRVDESIRQAALADLGSACP